MITSEMKTKGLPMNMPFPDPAPNPHAAPSDEPPRQQHRSRSAPRPDARLLLRLDGIFEGALGLLLLLSPATGLYTALALPGPASRPVVVAIGVLLLPLLPILWRAARAPQRAFVLALAGANGAGALLFVLWVVLDRAGFPAAGAGFPAAGAGFPAAGAGFLLGVAAILAALAALEARAAWSVL
jgi:hypothetical protein